MTKCLSIIIYLWEGVLKSMVYQYAVKITDKI